MADTTTTEQNSNGCVWRRDETNLLLSVVMEKNILKLFNVKKHPRKDILKIIENEFHNFGFINKNIQQINDKWKNLTKKYKNAEKNKNSGSDIPIKCPYYEELDNIFKTQMSPENVKNIIQPKHFQCATNGKSEPIQCGEIFYINNSLNYNCILCECVEENAQKFEEHFYSKHLNDLSTGFFYKKIQSELKYHKGDDDCLPPRSLSVELTEVKEEFDESSELLIIKNNENWASNNYTIFTDITMLDTNSDNKEDDFIDDDPSSIHTTETPTNKQYSGIFHDDKFLIEENIILKCVHCDIVFKDKKSMRDHIKKLKKFNCSECGLGFCGQKRYIEHLNFVHFKIDPITNNDPFFTCDYCEIKLKDKKAFRQHIRNFKDSKFKCHECRKQFCGSKRYHEHNTAFHNIKQEVQKEVQPIRTYMCYVCKISHSTKANLKKHMRLHTGEKPHKCTECDKAFPVKTSLIMHIRHHHTFERPFMCTECGSCFAFQRLLNAHIRRHRRKEEGPQSCTICSKILKNIDSLKIHLKTHTIERNFVCLECEKSFKTRSVYRQHLLIHSAQRQFPCQYCDLSFSQSAGRRGHVRRVHETIK